jgi:hypothetical protein
MTNDELKQIAEDFTRGLLDSRTSDRMCLAVCMPLQGFLSFFGIETRIIEWDLEGRGEHFTLRLKDGNILDPTADQLTAPDNDTPMPAVYIGPAPRWYGRIVTTLPQDGCLLLTEYERQLLGNAVDL